MEREKKGGGLMKNKKPKQMTEEEEMRWHYNRMRNMSYAEWKLTINLVGTRGYAVAQRHFSEAADITLQPKQKKTLFDKAEEIRELWDGIHSVLTPSKSKGAELL
jgi:hypothetical protein